MVERGTGRPAVYYYGARGAHDLFHVDELASLAEALPAFRFVPALSEPDAEAAFDGETGLITDVVARAEPNLADVDAYLCGPPPMVDAAIELLKAQGLAEQHIFYDKFTTTAETEESSLA
jgi:propane monooxygenase reductase subunit